MVKSLKDYYISITEKRREPEKNPFREAWYYAEKYRDDPEVYITFTEVDKVGINPQTPYNTPVGIYAYPLKQFWDKYIGEIKESEKYQKVIGDFSPFAGGSEYVNFLRLVDKKNFVEDMTEDYDSDDFENDYQILANIYMDEWYRRVEDDSDLKKFGDNWGNVMQTAIQDARGNHPVMKIWNVTRTIAKWFSEWKGGRIPARWNAVLRKDLGYSGFGDKTGSGFIHPSEPMQAVFLTTKAFDVIERTENKVKKPPKETRDALEKVKKDPLKINELSEDMQVKIIQQEGEVEGSYFENIKNPSEKVQLTAVRIRPQYISLIDDPSERVQYNALKNTGSLFSLEKVFNKIENPTEDVKEWVITKRPDLIDSINDPPRNLVKKAIKRDAKVITNSGNFFIKEVNMDDELWKIAFDNVNDKRGFLSDLSISNMAGLITEGALKYFIENEPVKCIGELNEIMGEDDVLYALDHIIPSQAKAVTRILVDKYVESMVPEMSWEKIPEDIQMKLVEIELGTVTDMKYPTEKVKNYVKKKQDEV